MAISKEHELHTRRKSRNIFVSLALVAFVFLVFAISIAKFQDGQLIEGFDHSYRSTLLKVEE